MVNCTSIFDSLKDAKLTLTPYRTLLMLIEQVDSLIIDYWSNTCLWINIIHYESSIKITIQWWIKKLEIRDYYYFFIQFIKVPLARQKSQFIHHVIACFVQNLNNFLSNYLMDKIFCFSLCILIIFIYNIYLSEEFFS